MIDCIIAINRWVIQIIKKTKQQETNQKEKEKENLFKIKIVNHHQVINTIIKVIMIMNSLMKKR